MALLEFPKVDLSRIKEKKGTSIMYLRLVVVVAVDRSRYWIWHYAFFCA